MLAMAIYTRLAARLCDLMDYARWQLHNPGKVRVSSEWVPGNSFQYAAAEYCGWRSRLPYISNGELVLRLKSGDVAVSCSWFQR